MYKVLFLNKIFKLQKGKRCKTTKGDNIVVYFLLFQGIKIKFTI